MALVPVTIYPLARWAGGFWSAGGTSRNISAAIHWSGVQFMAPETGTITEFHFRTGTVSSPLFTLEAGIVELDANGLPIGADISVGDAVTNPSATTHYSATGLSASVTKGTFYGGIVRVKSGTYTSGSANVLGALDCDYAGSSYSFNYGGNSYNTAGSDTKGSGLGLCYPKYSTGWIGSPYYLPACSHSTTLSTGTASGNVAGNKFTIPARMKVTGYWVCGDLDGPANVEMYAGSDNTPITNSSITIIPAYRVNATSQVAHVLMLGTPVTLESGTYRVGLRNTSTTASSIYTKTNLVNSEAYKLITPLPFMRTEYASGAWTDTNTALCGITPLVGEIEDGVQVGGSAVEFLGAASL